MRYFCNNCHQTFTSSVNERCPYCGDSDIEWESSELADDDDSLEDLLELE